MGINPCGSVIGVNSWESVIGMPIVREVNGHWNNPKILERNLRIAMSECGELCERQNGGRICIALSGGIDSSLSVALIRDELGQRAKIHTFTIGRSKDHPDVVHARIVARLFKTIHHEYIPEPLDIGEAIKERQKHPQLFIGDGGAETNGLGVFLLYRYIFRHTPSFSVICHDGIDELLGGYWAHRQTQTEQAQAENFQKFWGELRDNHLIPLARKSGHFGVTPIFPYLQKRVVNYITAIPLEERTSKAESKIPLRRIAAKYLPPEIIQRRKLGFCDAMVSATDIAKRK